MKYNFDQQLDRQGTSSVKWEFVQDDSDPTRVELTDRFFGEDRTLPLWVADMDFASPQPVIDALVARAQHGVFGYTNRTDSYYQAVTGWMKRRHGWQVEREWIVTTPGVVAALSMLVRTFVPPGEKVLIQPPVYYPFYTSVERNGAQVARNPLIYRPSGYQMNFADLEAKARDPQVKAVILCNPHNPVGRVWTREELARFGQICLQNNLLVIADEIHGDLIIGQHRFTPFATISQEFERRSITCTSPSKTFNLAGLTTSNIIISDPEKRAQFQKTIDASGLFGVNVFGQVALEASYTHGEDWLEQMLVYLRANFAYLKDFVARRIPQISVVPLEGTYLAWLDCRGLEMQPHELKQFMQDEARVYLDEGYLFGTEGEGFERINLACPRAILAEALERIGAAVKRRHSASGSQVQDT